MTTASETRPVLISRRQTRAERAIEAGLPFAGPAVAFVLMMAAACGVVAGA